MGKLIKFDPKNFEENEKNIDIAEEVWNMIEENASSEEQPSEKQFKMVDKNGTELDFDKRKKFVNNFLETSSFEIIDKDDMRMMILTEFPEETIDIIKEKYLNDRFFRMWISLYSEENETRFKGILSG